ncbi:hypothetical protein SeMB42_g01755 [Synchytrium endobioticum]|uniref:Ubinuclein middle domain-containing protein n=1 Tax=Synchytrium endobioticum TaxID=286115 RepID=A0A507DJT6_9FUNG|nr:hypothetical protein SeLEV6574_g02188 [Synchytrium endobioticum]TPX51922.1 hypothetical protein SeMB42_g01755 [Synchytrium endobioticum]
MRPKLAFPDAPPPIDAKSIRLHVNLTRIDANDPNAKDTNIISYRELLRKHIAAQQPPNTGDITSTNHDLNGNPSSLFASAAGLSGVDSDGVGVGALPSCNGNSNGDHPLDSGGEVSDRDGSDDDDDDQTGDGSQTASGGQDGPLSKKKKRTRPTWDDYDLDDAFIDDSDLFGAEVNYAPPAKWDYGFFVWRGPVENFFDEYGVIEDAQSAGESPQSKRKGKSKLGRPPKSVKDSPAKVYGNGTAVVKEGEGNDGNATSSTEPSAKKRKETDGTEKARKKKKSGIPTASSTPGTSASDPKNGGTGGLDGSTSIGALLQNLMRESTNAKPLHSAAPSASASGNNIDNNNNHTPPKSTSALPPLLHAPIPFMIPQQPQPSPTTSNSPPQTHSSTADPVARPSSSSPSPDPVPVINPTIRPSKSVSNEENTTIVVKRRKMSPQPVDPELDRVLQVLREAAAKESFADKKHFPPSLKPLLHEAARVSLRLGENHDNFIAHITSILPYNTFTMKKLVGKMILPEKIQLKENQLDQLYGELRRMIDAAMPGNVADYEAKRRHDASSNGENPTEVGIDGEGNGLPEKKFKMTPTMREIMSHIVNTEIVLAEAKNDFRFYHGEETMDYDKLEKATRREANSKLLRCWPEGWMQPRFITGGLTTQRKKIERHEQKSSGSGGLASPSRNGTSAVGINGSNPTVTNSGAPAAAVVPGQPPRKKLSPPTKSNSVPINVNHTAQLNTVMIPVVPSPLGAQPVLQGASDDDVIML